MLLLVVAWPGVRLAITVVHEGGHALAAVLVGRELSGIRVHSDTSGLTVSRGKARGPGMVVMLAAGYLAPALLGLAAAFMVGTNRPVGLLWILVLLLATLLLWIRNVYGFVVLLVLGGGIFALTWWGSETAQSFLAYFVAWVLLLGAPRPLVELLASGRRRRRTSDVDQLAGLTHIPALLWTLVMLTANLAGLVLGVSLIAPELID